MAFFPVFGGICFFNDAATTEIYTLSLHDALPICKDAKVADPKAKEYMTLHGVEDQDLLPDDGEKIKIGRAHV